MRPFEYYVIKSVSQLSVQIFSFKIRTLIVASLRIVMKACMGKIRLISDDCIFAMSNASEIPVKFLDFDSAALDKHVYIYAS